MPKRGKKYKEAAKLVDKTNLYEIDEDMQLLTKNSKLQMTIMKA